MSNFSHAEVIDPISSSLTHVKEEKENSHPLFLKQPLDEILVG